LTTVKTEKESPSPIFKISLIGGIAVYTYGSTRNKYEENPKLIIEMMKLEI
jgi:hypothetical protein